MKKILWASFILIILFIMISFSFFYQIWAAEKSNEEQMVEKAKMKLPLLKDVEQTDYFAGDKSYYITLGKDALGDSLIVWTNQEDIGYRYLTSYLTKEKVTELVKGNEKGSVIKRISLGMVDEERLVYEVLFESSDQRLGYSYYDLQTGEFIKKYRLGVASQ